MLKYKVGDEVRVVEPNWEAMEGKVVSEFKEGKLNRLSRFVKYYSRKILSGLWRLFSVRAFNLTFILVMLSVDPVVDLIGKRFGLLLAYLLVAVVLCVLTDEAGKNFTNKNQEKAKRNVFSRGCKVGMSEGVQLHKRYPNISIDRNGKVSFEEDS